MLSDGNPAGHRCALCGETIGVYEPLVLIGHDQQVSRTSRLKHPGTDLPGTLVHEDCYAGHRPSSETLD